MEDYKSLSHTKWQCKYHVISIPKYRRKKLFGVVRRELGEVFHRLAEQKGCRIEEGHIMPDRVHMPISIPPKPAVSSVVGYIKGKSAIHVARHFLKRIATTLAGGCGRGDSSSIVLVETRKLSGDTFESRNGKTGDWINWSFL